MVNVIFLVVNAFSRLLDLGKFDYKSKAPYFAVVWS